MLREIRSVRQEKGANLKRWFQDDYFNLITWSQDGRVISFELSYDRYGEPHLLRWRDGEGYLHSSVDEGEGRPGRPKMSPIPDAPKRALPQDLPSSFEERSVKIDPEISRLVIAGIKGYLSERSKPD